MLACAAPRSPTERCPHRIPSPRSSRSTSSLSVPSSSSVCPSFQTCSFLVPDPLPGWSYKPFGVAAKQEVFFLVPLVPGLLNGAEVLADGYLSFAVSFLIYIQPEDFTFDSMDPVSEGARCQAQTVDKSA